MSEEIEKIKEEVKKKKCIVCGRLIGEHTPEELKKCVHSLGEPEILRRIAKEQNWNVNFSDEEEENDRNQTKKE